MKIKNQLILSHGILVFIAIIIVVINLFTYKSMESDAYITNQSGKLRMLSYNMLHLSSSLKDEGGNQDLRLNLNFRIREFDWILYALDKGQGDKSLELDHPATEVKLGHIMNHWNNEFKPYLLQAINQSDQMEWIDLIRFNVDVFVADIDDMVTTYSSYSRSKISQAFFVNGLLIAIIVLVTVYSFLSTNNRIQKPMALLISDLKALSLFDENFSQHFKNLSDSNEINEMQGYFNEMMYDSLTKAYTRRAGLSKLSRCINYDDRRHSQLSLCFIDINGLKDVNDLLGHKVGDELIVSVVDGVKREIREQDYIIRMGGDEFLIVFNGIDLDTSERVWERINMGFKKINDEEHRNYLISVSHGMVNFDNFENNEMEHLIKVADDKMYEEKRLIKDEMKIKIVRNS